MDGDVNYRDFIFFMNVRGFQYGQAVSLAALSKFVPGEQAKKALRRSFAKKLVELRGVPMKLSQILSLGKDEGRSLAHQEAILEIEPMPFDVVQQYLQANAPDLLANIQNIDHQGLAASLGQVHKLQLKDGRVLAVKVKYPEIHPQMNLDNALFGLVTKTFNNFKEGFSLQDYQKVIRDELEGELDYGEEIKKQDVFFQAFSKQEGIVIPQVSRELSGRDHIVMTWEEGIMIDQFLKAAGEEQKQEAVNLFLQFYLTTIFLKGMIHADPNRGNFAFRISGGNVKLVVYDYGSVIPFDRKRALLLLKIMQIAKKGKGDLIPWLVGIGFDPQLLKPLHKSLLAFSELLFEPLLTERRYYLSNWNRKKRAEDILGEHRWNFAIAANADLLPFMRAMQGMFYYIDLLDAGMYAWPKIEEIWDFYKKELKELQPAQLAVEPLDLAMAQFLRIEIIENGRQKVALSFPRSSIEDLQDIIPDDVTEKLKEQNIEVKEIVKKARQNGYAAMNLFRINNGLKDVRVSLE